MFMFQCRFPGSTDLCGIGRKAGAGEAGEWSLCAQQETPPQPFEFQDFEGELMTFLLQVLYISTGNEGFLQLFVCWSLGSACRPQQDSSCAAVVERGLSSGPGECDGVSERLAQLPPSPPRGRLQETVP